MFAYPPCVSTGTLNVERDLNVAKGKKPAKIAGRSKNEQTGAPVGDKDTRFVVVQIDNVANAKYPRQPGDYGFSYEQALEMAQPAHPDAPKYAVISVDEYDQAVASDSVTTLRDVVASRRKA